jgi:hypothetical protein
MNSSIYIILAIILLMAVIIVGLWSPWLINRDWFMNPIEPFITNPNKPSDMIIKNEIKKMTLPDKLVSDIKTCSVTNFPLSQYAIKGSYNTANSGKYVSTDAIKYAIKRGCRFLDFEVYIDETGSARPIALVAYSSATITSVTNTKTVKLDSLNIITLNDALSACISNAFSASIAPNFGDPLFIHLRLKTGASSLLPIVNAIKNTIMSKLYVNTANKNAKPVNNETILADIMGKIVLVVDTGLAIELADVDVLKPYINSTTNNNNWKRYFYRDIDNMATNPPIINIKTDASTPTNVTELSFILPTSNTDTIIPSPFSVFGEYGIQTLLVPLFSVNNPTIVSYEQLFNSTKGGVVPFSSVLAYSQDMNETNYKPKKLGTV